jgi:hypothetical protein
MPNDARHMQVKRPYVNTVPVRIRFSSSAEQAILEFSKARRKGLHPFCWV